MFPFEEVPDVDANRIPLEDLVKFRESFNEKLKILRDQRTEMEEEIEKQTRLRMSAEAIASSLNRIVKEDRQTIERKDNDLAELNEKFRKTENEKGKAEMRLLDAQKKLLLSKEDLEKFQKEQKNFEAQTQAKEKEMENKIEKLLSGMGELKESLGKMSEDHSLEIGIKSFIAGLYEKITNINTKQRNVIQDETMQAFKDLEEKLLKTMDTNMNDINNGFKITTGLEKETKEEITKQGLTLEQTREEQKKDIETCFKIMAKSVSTMIKERASLLNMVGKCVECKEITNMEEVGDHFIKLDKEVKQLREDNIRIQEENNKILEKMKKLKEKNEEYSKTVVMTENLLGMSKKNKK
ncbi:hypothetical protein QTN25_006760 [Entamoeba marina]